MNWTLAGTSDQIADAELAITHGDHEKDTAKPDQALVKAARKAAGDVAKALGGREHHIEVHAHETTKGRGFKPGHLTISISRLDPKR